MSLTTHRRSKSLSTNGRRPSHPSWQRRRPQPGGIRALRPFALARGRHGHPSLPPRLCESSGQYFGLLRPTINIFEVNGAWTEGTLTNNTIPPKFPTPVFTFSVAPSNAKGFMLIDVTQAVKDWQSGARPNNGLTLVPSNASNITTSRSPRCTLRTAPNRRHSADGSDARPILRQ